MYTREHSRAGILLVLSVILLSLTAMAETPLFVDGNTGNDANPGTYEAPFKTIDKAKQKVATLTTSASGPITVYIRGGKYYLDSTLVFTPRDGGSAAAPVTYSAFRGEKVIISGAKKIKPAWTTYAKDSRLKVANIGKTIVPDQIFINGEQRVMARYPNFHKDSVFNGYARDCISKSRVSRWKNVAEGPGYIRGMHGQRWGANSFIITGVKSDGNVEYDWVGDNQRGSTLHQTYRMVENLFEELDAPNEWFYRKSTGELFFYPPSGLDLDGALIEVPVLEELFKLAGTSVSSPIKHLTFRNLTFTQTHRTLFTGSFERLLLGDWCVVRAGTIFMLNAENITVKGCLFEKTGGNDIFMSGYNNKHWIYNNRFIESGATCIQTVGDTSAVRTPSFWTDVWKYKNKMPDSTPGPKTDDYPRDILIENNYMYNLGRHEKQTSGVNISMSSRITVRHNTVDISPRSGLAINDGTWGGHVLEYNDVRRCVLETSDHGPFNAWGRDRYWAYGGNAMGGAYWSDAKHRELGMKIKPYALLDAKERTIIRNNRWYQPPNPEFRTMGVDLDDGCTNYEIYNNLCLNCPIKLREGFFRKVYNNVIINRAFEMHVWFCGGRDTIMKNIIVADHNSTAIYRNLTASVSKDSAFMDSSVYWADGRKITESNSGLRRVFQADQDKHSLIGTHDPLFMDSANGDFRVKPGSPALNLGFVNFPMDSFGRMEVPPDTSHPLSTAVLPQSGRQTVAALAASWSTGRLTVSYTLARKTNVSIDLFSVNGKRVARLLSGKQAKGSFVKTWERDHSALRALAPATYLLVVNADGVNADGSSLSRRIMLVR